MSVSYYFRLINCRKILGWDRNRRQMCSSFRPERVKGRNNMRDLGVCKRIILKNILKKYD
jgi:hypothetical protein